MPASPPPLPWTRAGRRHGARTEPEGVLASALRTVSLVGSPLAIGTVLLYYFGWVRATVQARALGYDTTVLELTTSDYLLTSIGVLFIPFIAVLLLAVLLQRLTVRTLDRFAGRKPVPRWVAPLRRAWLGVGALGAVVLFGVPQWAELTLPLVVTATAGTYLYGRLVGGRLAGAPPMGGWDKTLVVTVVALAVFWDTERLAQWYGTGYAVSVARHDHRYPAVTVYSKQRLLIGAPGIVETRLAQPDAVYGYRYDGLQLIQRSGDRYFLLAVDGTPDTGHLVILKDGDGLRFELGR